MNTPIILSFQLNTAFKTHSDPSQQIRIVLLISMPIKAKCSFENGGSSFRKRFAYIK